MIIKRTFDEEVIKRFLLADGIWDRISADGDVKEELRIEPEFALYLTDKNEEIGLFVVHTTSGGDYKCHVQVLPGKRKEYAAEFGNAVLKWVWDRTSINRMVASIPVMYPDVAGFAEKMGFTRTGEEMSTRTRNGVYYTRWLYAIERGE